MGDLLSTPEGAECPYDHTLLGIGYLDTVPTCAAARFVSRTNVVQGLDMGSVSRMDDSQPRQDPFVRQASKLN